MNFFIFNIVIPNLYVKIELSQFFILFLEHCFGVRNLPNLQKYLLYPPGIYCRQNLSIELIDIPLSNLILFLHKEMNIDDLSFFIH